MKRLLLLFSGVFFFTTLSVAGLTMGIKVGANFGNVRTEVPNQEIRVDYGTRTGFVAGLYGETPTHVVTNLNVRGELLYVQKGTEYDIFRSHVTVTEDEVTITPYLVYYLTAFPKVQPFLEAGPEGGVNVQDRTSIGGDSFDSNGNWSSVNLSLNLGAGFRIPLGNRSLTVHGRYNLGLHDMGSWDSNSVGDVKSWTNGVQILIGYSLFNLP